MTSAVELIRVGDHLKRKPRVWASERTAVGFVLALYTAFYLVETLRQAAANQPWLDEILTIWLCRLPSMADVWTVLRQGGPDSAPPAFYVICRAFIALTGNEHLGIRLLSIIGFYTAQIAIFLFVRPRFGYRLAAVAMLIPAITGAEMYSIEGRPYAAVLGCSALAALLWQRCAEPRRNTLLVVGLGLSLALALSLHFYAVLVLIPFGIAELARTYENRKIDWAIWSALVCSVFPLLVYWPLIAPIRAFNVANAAGSGYFARPRLMAVIQAATLLGWTELAAPLSYAICILALIFMSLVLARMQKMRNGLRLGEAVLVASFMAFPLLTFAMAKLGTGTFNFRYNLVVVIGVSVGVAVLVSRLRNRQRVGLGLCVILLVLAIGGWVQRIRSSSHDYPDSKMLEAMRTDLPIVVGEGLKLVELTENAPRLSGRLVYLTSPSGVQSPDLTNEAIVKACWRLRPLNVMTAESFVAAHRSFLLYHTEGSTDSVTDWVLKTAGSVEILAHHGSTWLFRVSS